MIKKVIYTSIFILLTLQFVGCNNRSIPKTFLIPADYEGPLRIILLENCGTKPTIENGREIFEFQNNGFAILKTDIGSRTDIDFYLVDRKGERTKVNEISNLNDRDNKTPVIVAGGLSVSTSYYNNKKLVAGGSTCQDFYLYNKNTAEIKKPVIAEELDLLTNSLVKACRSNN